MDMRFEYAKERKEFLNLTECDTKKIFTIIFDIYKQKILTAPRKTVDYSIDIIMCNMNGFNRLGKLDNLYNTWGDNNFYVDINRSAYRALEVHWDGSIALGSNTLKFGSIKELKNIDNISFSLKELIELCKKDDFKVRIYARDEESSIGNEALTLVRIETYKKFEMNESIEEYLKTVKQKNDKKNEN